jgi:hypothetical protein
MGSFKVLHLLHSTNHIRVCNDMVRYLLQLVNCLNNRTTYRDEVTIIFFSPFFRNFCCTHPALRHYLASQLHDS